MAQAIEKNLKAKRHPKRAMTCPDMGLRKDQFMLKWRPTTYGVILIPLSSARFPSQ